MIVSNKECIIELWSSVLCGVTDRLKELAKMGFLIFKEVDFLLSLSLFNVSSFFISLFDGLDFALKLDDLIL